MRPSLDEFVAASKSHNVIPVSVEVVADTETPLSIFQKVANSSTCFLLESAEAAGRWSRWSFVGVSPLCVAKFSDGVASIEGFDENSSMLSGLNGSLADCRNPFEQLRAISRAFSRAPIDGLPPLHGGAVGYVSYDAARHLEPTAFSRSATIPEMMMQMTSSLVAMDHFRGVATVIVNAIVDDDPRVAYERAARNCEEIVSGLGGRFVAAKPTPPPTANAPLELPRSNVSPQQFHAMVDKARAYIEAGDIFQSVVSQRFSVDDTTASDLDVYRMLRQLNPSPYMYLLRFDERSVVGSSPEALVRLTGDQVLTHPIAGTRPRGTDAASDLRLEAELLADTKERAEHLMLVDLARNDLGRVCEPGSVVTTRFMEVERYSHVMHLLSEVTGTLSPDADSIDVLSATFPAGTVSGAPKVRAMQIIDELEADPRGIYGGIVGYLDFTGNMDTAIALRTVVIEDGCATVQAGSGIVADSDPIAEFQESINKASAPLAAIRAAEDLR